jgi:hypothetical protein
MTYSIVRTWAVPPPTGTDYDSAYIVRLAGAEDGTTHDLVVEYAAPSTLTSVGYAEEIARQFLRLTDPPHHVIVDTQGAVRVVSPAAESA